ncbi:uncharacterized protein FIBRA_08125 [Fibroporia radiculosa]|uniref:Uncharacterized protein n=1 Tax=Fibroporia radiculosa TaxID=599839 RepID=J4I282_9APHY|nr:uncharacterized protein FIBRA_08125 [Fibroporia radiculosa]CCM05887.1 predicted protein [Fibroporia radiculosa]
MADSPVSPCNYLPVLPNSDYYTIGENDDSIPSTDISDSEEFPPEPDRHILVAPTAPTPSAMPAHSRHKQPAQMRPTPMSVAFVHSTTTGPKPTLPAASHTPTD